MTTLKPGTKRVRAHVFPPMALAAGSAIPLHRQVHDWFQHAISSGQLRPGQGVPSTRSLAAELGVSRSPLLSAYEQLHAEGYFQTQVGSGTCVSPAMATETPAQSMPGKPAPGPARPRRPSRRATALMALRDESWLRSTGAFRVSQPALDHFPLGVWSSLLARHARRLGPHGMVYGDPMGHAPLREAIAAYLGAARGVRCDASRVMVVTGSQLGLQLVAHALLDVGDPVWLEEPGYPGAQQAFTAAGVDMVPVPLDGEGLDVAAGLRRCPQARAAYITPSHQYPLGMAMSAPRRMQLLEWAARAGAWVIEDDYDSEFRFGGHPIASLQGMQHRDADQRVIYLGTLSKVLFPALRLGYLVLPADLVPAFRAARAASDIFPATLPQAAMADFILQGHFARHIRKMRVLYGERRALLADALARHAPRLQVVGAPAGMHLAVLLPAGVDDRALARRAADVGVSAMPLSSCYLKPPSRGGLILGYGGIDAAQIRDGVRRLARLL